MANTQEAREKVKIALGILRDTWLPREIAAGWTQQNLELWIKSMLDVWKFLNGETAHDRGFSIVRSLDCSVGWDGMETDAGKAILEVAAALREAGIDRYA